MLLTTENRESVYCPFPLLTCQGHFFEKQKKTILQALFSPFPFSLFICFKLFHLINSEKSLGVIRDLNAYGI